jgi:hypothetical protein
METIDVMLMWKDFKDFYKLITFTRLYWDHSLANFPTLIHFLFSWVEFIRSRSVPILEPNFEPSSNSLEVRASKEK